MSRLETLFFKVSVLSRYLEVSENGYVSAVFFSPMELFQYPNMPKLILFQACLIMCTLNDFVTPNISKVTMYILMMFYCNRLGAGLQELACKALTSKKEI